MINATPPPPPVAPIAQMIGSAMMCRTVAPNHTFHTPYKHYSLTVTDARTHKPLAHKFEHYGPHNEYVQVSFRTPHGQGVAGWVPMNGDVFVYGHRRLVVCAESTPA